ncbi:hypothetical protein GG804_19095 [Sphingomonas histidinilytica]|uniref:hypothetical protein n=1 Tax=Rhizorhabdus histidinilytica TaxID=439228 RepID=UPI001ADBB3BB|nr:hypothetical protein [Rhizorhabdus histidinilytica]MBO9378877.1 hypothetical protein [Rhizorhabdus histidinilytica]
MLVRRTVDKGWLSMLEQTRRFVGHQVNGQLMRATEHVSYSMKLLSLLLSRRRAWMASLGRVDKRDSQLGEVLIQAWLLEGQAWIAAT